MKKNMKRSTSLSESWASAGGRAIRASSLVAVAFAATAHAAHQPHLPFAPQLQVASAPFEWVKVRDNIFVVSGPDGNVTVQVGPEGAIVVDTQSAERAPALVAELNKLVGERHIRFLVNTSADPGHTGANLQVRNAGRQIAAGIMLMATGDISKQAVHMAHENTLLRLSAGGPGLGEPPNESYASAWYDLYFNGEGVVITHMPAAHTDGDSIVHFRTSDVLVAGEIWNTLTYPVIDVARGGSIQGELDALNTLIDLAIPRENAEGGTMIVPGRGRVGDESDLVEYRDIITTIRDHIKELVDRGMTLEQVKAAKPTVEYDGRWGATSGPWTTDMFVSAVYASLKAERSKTTKDAR